MRQFTKILIPCVLLLMPTFIFARVTESMTPDAILARIKPIGTVEAEGVIAKAESVAVELSATAGQDRYKSTCAVCHETGVGGAPKFRNAGDWSTRVAAGIDEMLKIAIQGKGAMPPKGTCMQCSDEELKMAIEYMIPKK